MKVLDKDVAGFLEFLLDDTCQVRKEVLSSRGWDVIIAPGRPNAMEIEWLSEAIVQSEFDSRLVSIDFEFCRTKQSYRALRAANTETVGDATWEFIEKYNVITNTNMDFLYYRHQSGDFFLVSGPGEFVKNSYRCSKKIAERMFFDYIDDFGPEGKSALTKIWDTYIGKSKQ